MSDFTSVAKSRARYYCKGAPVQFVFVELLRMEETGELIVTLNFKNIAAQLLTALTVHFRCKNTDGVVIMEDDFTYSGLQVAEGVCFGADDAVFVSKEPLSSVEVDLKAAQYGEAAPWLPLESCKPVPLPALKPMPQPVAATVNRLLGQTGVAWMPNPVQDGWQCGCGAFNYNVGLGAQQCSECGAGKAQLQAALRSAMNAGGIIPQAAPAPMREGAPSNTASYAPRPNRMRFDEDEFDSDAPTAVVSSGAVRAGAAAARVSIFSDAAADFIIKIVPLITLGASVVYVLLALLGNMLFGG